MFIIHSRDTDQGLLEIVHPTGRQKKQEKCIILANVNTLLPKVNATCSESLDGRHIPQQIPGPQ